MLKLNLVNVSLILLVTYSLSVEAKLYKWVDSNGVTHYGEVIPPEYANRDIETLKKSGYISKRPEKASPEDTKANAEADEKKKIADKILDEQKRRDGALLNTYSNEEEIDLALERSLILVNARIESNQMLLKSSQSTLDDLKQEAEHRTKLGRKIPESLTDDMAKAENRVEKFKSELHNSEEELHAVKTRFENEKLLYRKLKGTAPSN